MSGCLYGIAVGDLNNDGRTDVVAGGGNNSTARVGIWYQDSANNLLQNPVLLIPYTIIGPVEVADLNNDSKNEIVVIHNGWPTASVFAQDSTGYYTYQTFTIPYTTFYKPQGMSIGDVNNDGKKDIAIAGYGYGLVILYNSSTILSDNEHLPVNNDIIILPNPFVDKIMTNLPIQQTNSVAHIKIINMVGRECINYKGSLHTLDLSLLKKGIYTLILESNNTLYVKKIVKM